MNGSMCLCITWLLWPHRLEDFWLLGEQCNKLALTRSSLRKLRTHNNCSIRPSDKADNFAPEKSEVST